jgi:catechol 2,3-dioxygenase-like lactoylglutathione lyase family enzyme
VSRTGFIDHIGIGVSDLDATKDYYDDLMSVLGLREWFATVPGGPLNYGPDGDRGSQLFFYQADEAGTYSRGQTGLHHLAFLVESGRPGSTPVGASPRGGHLGRTRPRRSRGLR